MDEQRPQCVKNPVELLRLHGLARLADQRIGRGEDRLVIGVELARLRQRAAGALHHGTGATAPA
jgi:hypothetical protein